MYSFSCGACRVLAVEQVVWMDEVETEEDVG